MPCPRRPSSARYCAICVVLPEPVSPTTTNIWFYTSARVGPLSTYIFDRLHKLFAELVYRKTSPLLLDAHGCDLAVCDDFVGGFPSRLYGLLVVCVPFEIRRKLPLLLVCHRVKPGLVEIPRFRFCLLVGLKSLDFPSLFCQRGAGLSSTVESTILSVSAQSITHPSGALTILTGDKSSVILV